MASEPKPFRPGPIADVSAVRYSAVERPEAPLRTRLERARRALHDADLPLAAAVAGELVDDGLDLEPSPETQAVIGSAHTVLAHVADTIGDNEWALQEFVTAVEDLQGAFDFVWDRADHVADLGIAMVAISAQNAEDALRRAMELGEDTLLVRRYLGLCLLAAGRPDEARTVLSEVVRRAPDDWRAHQGLAASVASDEDAAKSWLSAAEILNREGGLAEALGAYRSAEALHPSADAKLGMADVLSRLNQFADAVQITEEVLAGDPDNYQARVLRVEALLGVGDAARAAEDARQLITVAPDDPVPLAYLGMAYGVLGEYVEAEFALSNAHRLLPDSAPIRAQFAAALQDNGDPDAARRVLDEGVENAPGDVELLLARAQLATTMDDLATAEADVAAIAEDDPSLSASWVYLGEIRSARGNLEGALEAADRALETEPGDQSALVLRGDVLVRLGRLDEGIDALWQARNSLPDAETTDALGMALLARATSDDYAQVERLGRDLIEWEPESSRGVFLLGEALLATGRVSEAVTLLDDAAGRIAADPFVDWLRAEVLTEVGQTKEALEVAQRAAGQLPGQSEVHALIGLLHNRLSFEPDQEHEPHVDAAIEALTRAIELKPGDVDSTTLLGQLYAGRQELEPAEQLLTRAMDLAREKGLGVDPIALADLGRVKYLQGRAEEALRVVTEASELDSEYANALVTKGEVLYSLGRYAESAEVLRKAADDLPQDAYVLSALGESCRMLNSFDEAERYLNASLELTPDDAYTLASRGAVWHAKGDDVTAMADLTRAIELSPSLLFALNNHLQMMLDKGRAGDAVPVWQKAVEHDPDNLELRTLYADTLRLAGRNREALPVVERVLQDQPEDLLALRVYGRTLLALDRVDEAAAQFERAATLDPQSAEAAIDLVDAQRRKEKWREALAEVRSAIDRMPKPSASLLVKQAWLFARLAQWEKAIASARQAVDVAPKDPDAYMVLGWSLRNMGDAEKSLVETRTAVELAPQDRWARKELGNALWEAGHREEALREFESVVARSEVATDDWGMHTLGWVLMFLGEYDRAATCVNRELASTTDPVSALFDLGLNSLMAGHIPEALEVYAEALAAVDDTDPDRAIGFRGPVAVAVHDLKVAVSTDRVEKSADVDALLGRLTERLNTLPAV